MKSKYKHLKFFLLGALTIGGIVPTISSCSKKSFLTNLQNISRNEYFSFANSLYNKKFASDDSGTDGTNITLKRVNDYINISKTKLTYKLLFAGASCSEDNPQVQNIVGTYLHNVTPTNNLDSKGLQEWYQKVKEENNKVGIDVVDFDEFKNYSTPLFIDNYVQGYKNEDGISYEQAEELKQILLSSYSNIGNEAMQNLDGQAELSFALVDDESFDQMSPGVDHYQARINAKLQAALKFEQVLFNDKQLQVKDASADFLRYYSDYTTDGKTTPDSKIEALSVGDVVPESLLQYLLTYNYDTVYGADYAEAEYYGFDITPDEICANTNSEYDPIALGLCSYAQPLSSLQSAYCTYGVGEFLPGYALELAIKSIDDTTDSHQCKIVFTKGVGYTNSNGEKSILWDTKDGTLESAKDDTQGDLEITIDINSNYIDLIQNISKNIYYNNQQTDLSLIQDFSLNSNNAYFDGTKNKRKKLDQILADYTGDVYDFEKNPFYITGSNIENVLPEEVKFPVDSLDNNLHLNQQFALIPTMVDSNVYTMTLKCGYVDTIESNENTNSTTEIFVTSYLPFVLDNSRTVDEINVQFDISQELKAKIEYSQDMYKSMDMLFNLGKLFKGEEQEQKNLNAAIKITKNQLDWHMGYVVLSSVALSLNVILTAYYTVIATLQFVSALSAATAVFALLAIAALIATTYALVDGIEKEQKVIENKKAAIDNLKESNNILGSVYGSEATIFVRNTFEKIKEEFSKQFDFIQKDYNPLFESNATFSNKGKAADILIKYTNNEDFLKNYKDCLENASIFWTNNGMSVSESCKPIDFTKVEFDNDNSFKKRLLNDSDNNNDTKYFLGTKESSVLFASRVPTLLATSISVLETLPESSVRQLTSLVEQLRFFEEREQIINASCASVIITKSSTPFSIQSCFDGRDALIYDLKKYSSIIKEWFDGDGGEFTHALKGVWDRGILYNFDQTQAEQLLQAYQDAFKTINQRNLGESFVKYVRETIIKEKISLADFFGKENPTLVASEKFLPSKFLYPIMQSKEVAKKFVYTIWNKTRDTVKNNIINFLHSDEITKEFRIPDQLVEALRSDEFTNDLTKNLKCVTEGNTIIKDGIPIKIKGTITTGLEQSFKMLEDSTIFSKVKTAFFTEHSKTMRVAKLAREALATTTKYTLNPIVALLINSLPIILDLTKLALEYFNVM